MGPITSLYVDPKDQSGVPDVITNWPSSHYSFDGTNEYLAPFIDVDGDGIYNNSDYPAYDLDAAT